MVCVTIALLDKVDDRLRRRLEDAKELRDHLIGAAGGHFLLASSDKRVPFEGVVPLQMELQERSSEGLIALIAEKEVDFGCYAFHVYADPFNTPGLVDDPRNGDGFIIRADEGTFYSPEDNLRLLRAMKGGSRIHAVYRRGGEKSAVIGSRLLLARSGPYHPEAKDILRPFNSKGKRGVMVHVLPFWLKGGKITVDNTFRPKTVRL